LNRYLHPTYADQLAKEARFIAWEAGWKMIMAHPMLGVGLRNFKAVMPDYQPKNVKVDSIAHNTYVEVTAELGVPGLIIFLGMWGVAFRMLGQVRRKTQTGRLRGLFPIALGLQAGMVAYLVNAFFLSTSWYKMVWFLLFLALCLNQLEEAARAPKIEEEEASPDWASYLDSQAEVVPSKYRG
jgi:O-antigen ligase